MPPSPIRPSDKGFHVAQSPLMRSSSQYGQDVYCYNQFFRGYSHGVFLEIGADDGVDKSNTLFFERLGWTGLCVEPSISRFQLLKENRKCICENCAVAEKTMTARFMDIMGWGKGLSGIIDKYDRKHMERIEKELKHPENRGYQVIDVECISLNELLQKHRMFKIDFCSIDTEGGELAILKSLDMKHLDFHVICVENNYEYPDIRAFMASIGFEMVTKLNIDEVYRKVCRR